MNCFPIFIVGSHRSATSMMLKAIQSTYNVVGNTEGYIWPTLHGLKTTLDGVFSVLGGSEQSGVGRDFSVKKIGSKRIFDMWQQDLDALHKEMFSTDVWVDKTPGVEMIRTLPLVYSYYPNAAFIFMKRRGIENVDSRKRRFDDDFWTACRRWTEIMDVWLDVRSRIGSNLVEVEQSFLSMDTEAIAQRIVNLLGGGDDEVQSLVKTFSERKHEVTKEPMERVWLGLEDMEWPDYEKKAFVDICGGTMAAYRYPLSQMKLDEDLRIYVDNYHEQSSIKPRVLNANRWCSIPAFPFAGHFLLHPNEPGKPPVVFEHDYSKIRFYDRFEFKAQRASAHPEARGALVRVVISDGKTLIKEIERELSSLEPFSFVFEGVQSLEKMVLRIEVDNRRGFSDNYLTGIRLSDFCFR